MTAWLPVLFSAGLVSLGFLPSVREQPTVLGSLLGAPVVLLAWTGWIAAKKTPEIVVALRSQHYIQASVQVAVLAYWGWYWSPVYDFAALIVAQLLFAYGFEMLLHWSRGRRYQLGFGPFPIILSINLFLWFSESVFYFQFLLIAVGFLGKEFVRWERNGRSTHIFNPSAFALGIFSIALLLTGTSDLTFGEEIATTLTLAPRIYLFIFLAGLVVMHFFAITLIAASAAATLFTLSALAMAVTGVPFFLDSDIPAAVFLGLHLLVTDPSTSPRTPAGKVVFGTLYGVGVFVLYGALSLAGAPTFYDKLLCVPLLNLSVRWIDRAVAEWTVPVLRLAANGGHVVAWAGLFAVMTAAGRTDGTHPGDRLPFWEVACAEERLTACNRLNQLEETYCADNSAWACNALAGRYLLGEGIEVDPRRAEVLFTRACELRSHAACLNLLDPSVFRLSPPKPLDLRLLLREGGRNLIHFSEEELFARGCAHGWAVLCDGPFVSAVTAMQPTPWTGADFGPISDPAPSATGTSGGGNTEPAIVFDPEVELVEVPAGQFIMGSDREDRMAFANERWASTRGSRSIDLPRFFIARTETTVAQFAAFARDTGHPASTAVLDLPPDHPVTSVSLPDALAYARWLDRRLRNGAAPAWLSSLLGEGYRITLPTESEWEKAARGLDGRRFPWGEDPRSDRARFGATTPLSVGSVPCPECPYGLSDMSGNVWEWTLSPYTPELTPPGLGEESRDDALWVMRGGSFADEARNVRAAVRGAADPGVRRPFLGFRVALTR